uniref:Uncharacterized protein n=1 Tax=Ralstonia solanacearum TaxID=305 RepID=A0A0S4X7J2_RALSL|nr:protein of unknown function [Ralstonia solanacearum]CUV36016.1 protein of unknown function [Ralstonia solanacearum]CUV42358.1 protein of unknown function [Ralstonia solanacearum]CUV59850.1 protein of unknown function [Ralstonia solanacearum]
MSPASQSQRPETTTPTAWVGVVGNRSPIGRISGRFFTLRSLIFNRFDLEALRENDDRRTVDWLNLNQA